MDIYTTAVIGNAWSISVTAAQATALVDGSYTVQTNLSDAAGNPAIQATRSLTVDETPPTVSSVTASPRRRRAPRKSR